MDKKIEGVVLKGFRGQNKDIGGSTKGLGVKKKILGVEKKTCPLGSLWGGDVKSSGKGKEKVVQDCLHILNSGR